MFESPAHSRLGQIDLHIKAVQVVLGTGKCHNNARGFCNEGGPAPARRLELASPKSRSGDNRIWVCLHQTLRHTLPEVVWYINYFSCLALPPHFEY